eukprot:1176292-Prorocentrum_minimum.AAC.1
MAQHLSSTGGAAEEAGGGPHVLPVHQQPPQDHHLPRLAQVLQGGYEGATRGLRGGYEGATRGSGGDAQESSAEVESPVRVMSAGDAGVRSVLAGLCSRRCVRAG